MGWRLLYRGVDGFAGGVGTPTVFRGPDEYVYLRMQLPTPGKRFATNCVANVVEEALEKIWGTAIFCLARGHHAGSGAEYGVARQPAVV